MRKWSNRVGMMFKLTLLWKCMKNAKLRGIKRQTHTHNIITTRYSKHNRFKKISFLNFTHHTLKSRPCKTVQLL